LNHTLQQSVANGARWLVGIILVFAPWAFGTTEPWSLATLQILTVLGAALTVVRVVRERAAREHAVWLGPMLALALYLGWQAANPSHVYQAAAQSLWPRPYVRWWPHSVDARTTWAAGGLLLTYAALFGIVRVGLRETRQWTRLSYTLVGSGFVMALAGILQATSGTTRLLWIRQPQQAGDIFGPFVNANNYAAYMNLLIPVALTLGRYHQQPSARHPAKSHPGYLLYFMAAVMIASVFLSRSRAGVVVCVGVVAGWWVLGRFLFRTTGGRAARTLGISLALLGGGVAGVLWFTGFAAVGRELATLERPVAQWCEMRTVAYRAVFEMFQDHWFYGIGAGTFRQAFPYYQPDSLAEFWRYAHCDWLQYLAELGVAGAVLAAVCAGATLWPAPSSRSRSETSIRTPLARTLALSVAGVSVHALVDFPLHIPALTTLAVTFWALLSMNRGAD
jgi:hypothetical protein